MSFQDLSLLIAVATPVAVLVTLNLVLWAVGERTTLLFPLPGASL